jgi:hypothetical protein
MECPPMKWEKRKNYFHSECSLPSGHPLLFIGVSSEKLNANLEKIMDLQAKFTIINTGNNTMKVNWIATNKQEKQDGEMVVQYVDGSEKRRAYLIANGKELCWFSGKFRDLMKVKHFTIQRYNDIAESNWNVHLKLEVDTLQKRADHLEFNNISIPISAYFRDSL